MSMHIAMDFIKSGEHSNRANIKITNHNYLSTDSSWLVLVVLAGFSVTLLLGALNLMVSIYSAAPVSGAFYKTPGQKQLRN
jgi:hypothetical protein